MVRVASGKPMLMKLAVANGKIVIGGIVVGVAMVANGKIVIGGQVA